MNAWKQVLLAGYYWATHRARRRAATARSAAGSAPLMAVFYHRVADDAASPWTISNRLFARQIDWLRRHFELISLAEAQQRIESGTNHRAAVCITFDDGYAHNCDRALPLLIDQRIPCTYFVSSRMVLDAQPFPHDQQRGRPLAPNTPTQIYQLAQAGIEIGSHTRTHADLGSLTDPRRLQEELTVSRDELEDLAGRPVRRFAFPYGQHRNLSSAAFRTARLAGYEGVCSAYGGYNFPGDDPFHVQRFHGDGETIRLKNWATLDPRKLALTRRFVCSADTSPEAALDLAETLLETHA